MKSQDDILVEKYRETVGKEPQNLPADHPYLWQWEYRGTRAEREALEQEVLEAVGAHDEQEVLFT